MSFFFKKKPKKKVKVSDSKQISTPTNLSSFATSFATSFAPSVTPSVTEKELRDIPKEAEDKKNKLQADYNTLLKQTKDILDIYENNRFNSINLFDSYNNYVSENKKLEKQIGDTHTDIQTNDRKTFYEDEATETLNLYYSILLGLYIIIVFSFAVCWFVFPSTSTNPKILFIFICLILYPIFSTRILQYIMYLYNLLLDYLPKSTFLPKR